jgi:glycosyltransferase involved in cell wall biosynthesis
VNSGPRRPRILFVGPRPDSRGGIAQFTARLMSSLADDAETAALSFRRLYPRWTRAGRQAQDPGYLRGGIPSAPVLVAWLPWTWRAGAREAERFDPDLVVVQWWHPMFGPCLRSLAKAAKRQGRTVAFVCHNDRPHEPFPLWRTLTRLGLAKADLLFALSSQVGQGMQRLASVRQVEVLPLPPMLERKQGKTETDWRARIGPLDGPVVLFFGHVRRYKGLEDLIAAMPIVRRAVPATLVVAGPFFLPVAAFERQAVHLGVRDHVRFFPGYVPDEDVASLFEMANLVALPYRSASQSAILPLAAAYHTPVVATSVGAIPEVVGSRGILVPPRNPTALADGIVRALLHPPMPPAVDPSGWDLWRQALLRACSSPAPSRTEPPP